MMNNRIKSQAQKSLISISLHHIGLCIFATLCFVFAQNADASGADIQQAAGLSLSEVIKTFAAYWNAFWAKQASKRSKPQPSDPEKNRVFLSKRFLGIGRRLQFLKTLLLA